jgi:hypothetical protein
MVMSQKGISSIHFSQASTVLAKSSGGLMSNSRQLPDSLNLSQVWQHFGGNACNCLRH